MDNMQVKYLMIEEKTIKHLLKNENVFSVMTSFNVCVVEALRKELKDESFS